jgi:fatty acid desaturase
MIATLTLSAIGLAVSTIALVHAKVKISSVLVHHATHGKLLKNRTANRLVAEAFSTLALTAPFDEYKRIHMIHHTKGTFAGHNDEEARFLHGLGFRPGVKHELLWHLFWATLVSPRFHAKVTMGRLRDNFIQGHPVRNGAAWATWTAIIAAAACAQMLPGLFLGVVLPLVIGGNIGSFLELVSRHRWMIATPMDLRRQFELSHGRFPVAMPPETDAEPRRWMAWTARIAAATLVRLTVVPSDLAWHISHHTGLRPKAGMDVPPWSDATLAYSDAIHQDAELAAQSHTSILAAVDAWFSALAKEAPSQPRAMSREP